MKKIVLAFDSFKGSANSLSLSEAARRAIQKHCPHCEILVFPIADGGEGTTEAICSQLNTRKTTCKCHDPLMNPIEASYNITHNCTTAILEMAASSGLPLVPKDLQNPMKTTTFGTGEIIADALKKGCRKFIIGLGGSATNDAAIGMMAALGVRFLDEKGDVLQPVGSNLIKICTVDDSQLNAALNESEFTFACDVNNPFFGPKGAAYIFASQKGASPEEVEYLDKGLQQYAKVLKSEKHIDISYLPGAGAAGGMGGGVLPFLHAKLKPGIETILDILQFEDATKDADLIITGEGKLDEQTTMGKALNGILKIAKQKRIPIIALGGSVEQVKQLNEAGFTAVFSIQSRPSSLKEAMDIPTTLNNVGLIVEQIIRLIESIST